MRQPIAAPVRLYFWWAPSLSLDRSREKLFLLCFNLILFPEKPKVLLYQYYVSFSTDNKEVMGWIRGAGTGDLADAVE
jgi:hypothetical protein